VERMDRGTAVNDEKRKEERKMGSVPFVPQSLLCLD